MEAGGGAVRLKQGCALRRLSWLAACALLFLAGCLPTVNRPGARLMEPAIVEELFAAGDGSLLPVRCWLPEDGPVRAALVALHGFNDYSNFFAIPGSYLSRRGVACYAYDQRGFGGAPGRGLWSGSRAYTDDLAGFVREIRKRHPGVPLYLLGESMGGAVTIAALAGEHPPKADGVILVAPAVWGRETMPWYQRWLLAVASHTLPFVQVTGEGLHVRPTDNIELLRALGRDPKVIKATRIDTVHGLTDLMDEALARAALVRLPALVLYGGNDQVIPKEPIFLMLDRMPKTVRHAFYPHGYHMLLRDLQGDKPLADIAAWIVNHDATLPNGSGDWR